MPKIPTYTAQGRPTTEVGAVRSNIQISPTGGVAAALLPAAEQVTQYHIKKRNIAEKTESLQIVNLIKSEIDKTIQQNKDNINEDDAIGKLEKSYQSTRDAKLANIKNKRVKERVKNLLDIEYSEYVNKVKKNSYTALETETIKQTNNKLNDVIMKYSTSDNPILKSKYKTDGENLINDLAKDFEFPENKTQDMLKKFKKNILSGDFSSIVSKEEDLENISKLDEAYGGEKVLSNEEFAALSFDAVKKEIDSLTIVGDENADFDRAEDLVEEYEKIKRSNGFVPSKALENQVSALKEKINTELSRHESLMRNKEDTKEVQKYADRQREAVARSVADPSGMEEYGDSVKANEIRNEYDTRFKSFIRSNPKATKGEKKAYAFELGALLQDKYEDVEYKNIRSFSQEGGNRFNIVRQYNNVRADLKELQKGVLDPNTQAKYETLAKLNGFVDKKGKVDLNAFFNDYLPILKSQTQGE